MSGWLLSTYYVPGRVYKSEAVIRDKQDKKWVPQRTSTSSRWSGLEVLDPVPPYADGGEPGNKKM